jgi:hypothetical protein
MELVRVAGKKGVSIFYFTALTSIFMEHARYVAIKPLLFIKPF